MSLLESTHIAKLNALRALISSGSISQLEVAKATGVHQSQISRILAGNIRRASKNVGKLCNYAESASSLRPPPDVGTQMATILTRLSAHGYEESLALQELVVSLEHWRNSWRSGT